MGSKELRAAQIWIIPEEQLSFSSPSGIPQTLFQNLSLGTGSPPDPLPAGAWAASLSIPGLEI